MPMSGNNYVAPTWVNYGPPALDADELNAISGTLENLELSQGDIAAPYSKMGLTGTPTIGASLGAVSYTHLDVYKRQPADGGEGLLGSL